MDRLSIRVKGFRGIAFRPVFVWWSETICPSEPQWVSRHRPHPLGRSSTSRRLTFTARRGSQDVPAMSLRLLPAFVMDNDDDDDGNFTKWMSSYWGHGAEVGPNRERKRSFRRSAKTHHDRRASLPTVVRTCIWRERMEQKSSLQYYKNNPPTGPTKYDVVRTTDLLFV